LCSLKKKPIIRCHCERSEAISLFLTRLLRRFAPRNDIVFEITLRDCIYENMYLAKGETAATEVQRRWNTEMLDTGHLILDKHNNFKRMIQHPVSSIQYLTAMKYNAKNSPKIHDPKIFF